MFIHSVLALARGSWPGYSPPKAADCPGQPFPEVAQGVLGQKREKKEERREGEPSANLSELPARFAREGNDSTEPCALPRGARARLLPNWESAPTSVDEYAHRQPIEA